MLIVALAYPVSMRVGALGEQVQMNDTSGGGRKSCAGSSA